MAALSLPNLGVGMGAGTSATESVHGVSAVQRAAFDDAMTRKSADKAAPGTSIEGPVASQATSGTSPVGAVDDAVSRDRVRRSLDLEGPAKTSSEGDTILRGLQKLRGTFDDRHARITEIMNSKTVDTNALLAMQMEVAQYTLLVDVSSKLTGKTTQSLDTLMKGQ